MPDTIRTMVLLVAAAMLAAVNYGCSSPAEAAPSVAGAGAELGAFPTRARADLVALAKVDDSGHVVRSFNVADVQPTGDDANFTVKVTLGHVPSLDRLYSLASLSDARVGFTVDMGQTVGGPVFVDLAVAPDHTSGFYLAIFSAP